MNRFGLIGFPLGHSFSKNYFDEKFSREGITDAIYQNFPLEDIGLLTDLVSRYKDLKGLNITIPYKEKILPYLNQCDEVVGQLGACNCIRIANGELTGHNTDVIGFKTSVLEQLHPHHDRALILGEGGASKAVQYVLTQLGLPFRIVSRKAELESNWVSYQELSAEMISQHRLIINCTPVGTFPAVNDAPPIPYEAVSDEHYFFDLIYNPAKTAFLARAEERGALILNGLKMLIIQAEESWKIWNAEN